ncbi:MAG: histone deacetylase [Chloroflexi bacterium]|nr:histone deacetylase [Chloroflexota bacterium]
MLGTGFLYDPEFLRHNSPGHPESAQRLSRVWPVLEEGGVLNRLVRIPARKASQEELLAVHTASHLETIKRASLGAGRYVDVDTYVVNGSYDVAVLAAGGTIDLVQAVLSGEISNGYGLVRPPGHHATSARAMGFCLLNNVALAARAALAHRLVRRILVADIDVHHGNGTQEVFASDPDVFYFSVHQYPHYPGTGHWRETGEGVGEGTVLNVPLPAGVGDRGYARVIDEALWPVATRFDPDVLLVSVGYDAHWRDPLAAMNLTLTGYGALQARLVQMACELCEGRIVFVLEGGYDPDVLAWGVLNALKALCGDGVCGELADPVGASPRGEREVDALLSTIRRLHRVD